MGVTGNIYPAGLPIHAVALSVAGKKHCQVYKMRDRDSDYPHEPGGEHGDTDAGTITPVGSSPNDRSCEGRRPGTREQECFGQCGPFTYYGQCICWDWVCGDCCCHVYCRDHDAACECGDLISCFLGVAFHYITFSIDCAPCNNPGDIPCKSSTSGSSGGGSTCPSGQFYCVHSGSCQPNGSLCEPKCGPGTVYCARVGHCVAKPQCDVHNTCASGYVRIQGKCYKAENVQ